MNNVPAKIHQYAGLAGMGGSGMLAVWMISVSDTSQVALDVARQHGQEHVGFSQDIRSIRHEISLLRSDLLNRTSDRFTGDDAKHLDREIEAIENELRRLGALHR